MVEYTMVKKKKFAAAYNVRDLAMHFFTSSSHGNVHCKKYLEMFPIDKFLLF